MKRVLVVRSLLMVDGARIFSDQPLLEIELRDGTIDQAVVFKVRDDVLVAVETLSPTTPAPLRP